MQRNLPLDGRRRLGRGDRRPSSTGSAFRHRAAAAGGKTTIRRILSNPVYIGTQVSGVWVKDAQTTTFRRDLANPRGIVVGGLSPAAARRGCPA